MIVIRNDYSNDNWESKQGSQRREDSLLNFSRTRRHRAIVGILYKNDYDLAKGYQSAKKASIFLILRNFQVKLWDGKKLPPRKVVNSTSVVSIRRLIRWVLVVAPMTFMITQQRRTNQIARMRNSIISLDKENSSDRGLIVRPKFRVNISKHYTIRECMKNR